MLSTADKSTFAAQYKSTLEMLGTPFKHTDGAGTVTDITAHFIDIGADDAAVIQAVGIEARLVHAPATPLISKYDRLESPTGRVYKVHASHELFINELLVGQKLVVTT